MVPQVRPARTLVLIVIGELLAGSKVDSEHRDFAAQATCADLRLDLHIDVLGCSHDRWRQNDLAATVTAGADLRLDLHVQLLSECLSFAILV
jgi:hypothetical protein